MLSISFAADGMRWPVEFWAKANAAENITNTSAEITILIFMFPLSLHRFGIRHLELFEQSSHALADIYAVHVRQRRGRKMFSGDDHHAGRGSLLASRMRNIF